MLKFRILQRSCTNPVYAVHKNELKSNESKYFLSAVKMKCALSDVQIQIGCPFPLLVR